jgi:predicted O-linked N-acetylglucosamine transferase (SPINDLY family)
MLADPIASVGAVGANPIAAGRAALEAGDAAAAAQIFLAAARAHAADHESRYWLYSALVAGGDLASARPVLDEARDLHATSLLRELGVDAQRFRTDKAYCGDVGLALYSQQLMGPASLALGRSLDFDQLSGQHIASYGLSLLHQGRTDEAIDVFQVATDTFASSVLHEFLLYALFHAPDRMQRVADEARLWADKYAAHLTPAEPRFENDRTPGRKLRIGYVGPSFTRNQVAQFLLPVLDAHDPAVVEVFLYCSDPAGEGPLPPACKVRGLGNMTDADTAALIRKDKIDILVDVWGHTAGSRLGAFAYRPAPIQVAWINFVQTTGLDCMDYILHADSMEVPGSERYYTEEIWRIGPIVAPSRPSVDRLDPVPTPALKNGYVTFGSFNNPAKLSEITIAAWSVILSQRSADRLVLKYATFVDPVLQRVTQARFAAYGARPEQLEFRGRTTGVDYCREFQDIDLALDPSPCPGGTTSCDALANGVPLLTQVGEDLYGRIGVPVVEPCGLSELIADGWDDYVARALALTEDHQALNTLRAKVRPGFDSSPYCDEVGFTRNLETTFRQMFDRWLAAK